MFQMWEVKRCWKGAMQVTWSIKSTYELLSTILEVMHVENQDCTAVFAVCRAFKWVIVDWVKFGAVLNLLFSAHSFLCFCKGNRSLTFLYMSKQTSPKYRWLGKSRVQLQSQIVDTICSVPPNSRMLDHPVFQISPNPSDSGPWEAPFSLGPPATAASDPLSIFSRAKQSRTHQLMLNIWGD